jgi:transcriptional regulator with XRE-family HTH domain
MSDISQIDGQSVRRRREALGLGVQELATMACLSAKQIRQIEEGGMAAFYSENVKLTAARKVAGLLQMSEAQLFGQVIPQQLEPKVQVLEADHDRDSSDDGIERTHSSMSEPLASWVAKPVAESATLSRSEAWHELAQPPEDLTTTSASLAQGSDKSISALPNPSERNEGATLSTPDTTPSSEDQPPQNQTHFLIKVLALFLVALAAAALLKQQSLEEKPAAVVSEPPPSLMSQPLGSNDENANATGATHLSATQGVQSTSGIPASSTAVTPSALNPAPTVPPANPASGPSPTAILPTEPDKPLSRP